MAVIGRVNAIHTFRAGGFEYSEKDLLSSARIYRAGRAKAGRSPDLPMA